MLTVPLAEGGVSLHYVENDVYAMLHGANVNTGHDGEHGMFTELREEWEDVMQEAVLLCQWLCQPCHQKVHPAKKGVVAWSRSQGPLRTGGLSLTDNSSSNAAATSAAGEYSQGKWEKG